MEENELIPVDNNNAVEYTDDNIRHLSDMEHVRTRPGMYIGRLGDGAHAEDGIYVLLKEVIDNSIDEFKMQAGKKIEITVDQKTPSLTISTPYAIFKTIYTSKIDDEKSNLWHSHKRAGRGGSPW